MRADYTQTLASQIPRMIYVALALIVTGCGSTKEPAKLTTQSNAPSSIVPSAVPSKPEQSQMLAAKDALFAKLSGRLMEVMGSQGPVAAIRVCKEEASEIAAAVSVEHGVLIGRTGVRLRNTSNTAPDWAADLVRDRTETPIFAMLDNGDAAALLPIKLQGKCLLCHGPREEIAESVQNQLAKLYPDDEATGFNEGELRGWFWVQLASSSRTDG